MYGEFFVVQTFSKFAIKYIPSSSSIADYSVLIKVLWLLAVGVLTSGMSINRINSCNNDGLKRCTTRLLRVLLVPPLPVMDPSVSFYYNERSYTTTTTNSTNNNKRCNKNKKRPMVHLSSAPNDKFAGKNIGSFYPVIPQTITPRRIIPKSKTFLTPPYAAVNNVNMQYKTSLLFNDGNTKKNSHDNEIITINDQETIQKIRQASQLAAKMLQKACQLAQQKKLQRQQQQSTHSTHSTSTFMTTDDIDRHIHDELIMKHNAYPSPLNYQQYPKSICTSINEIICHGIPNKRILQNGDLLSIDISVYLNGVHGDNCTSIIVGGDDDHDNHDHHYDEDDNNNMSLLLEQKERAKRLINATKDAMYQAINICTKDTPIHQIGTIIHDVADQYGYRPMKNVCGHGIGHHLHMFPTIKHFRNYDTLTLQPGMVITIEPAFVEGHHAFVTWNDGWTKCTVDGGLAAQFEHTILITDDGGPPEILTLVNNDDED